MKVLQGHPIHATKARGGVVLSLYNLSNELSKYCDVEVFASESIKGAKFDVIKFKNKLDLAKQILFKKDYDLYHNHGDFWGGLEVRNKKFVQSIHGIFMPEVLKKEDLARRGFHMLQNNVIRHLVKKSDKVICVSNYIKDVLHEKWNVPEDKMQVIYGGVDINKFRPVKAEKTGKKILFVGNFSYYKGIDYLLESYMELLKKDSSIELTMIGKGVLQNYIEEFKAKNKLENLGIVSFMHEKDLIKAFSSHDLLVLPSRCEIFGSVVIEAMACKIPVVAFKCGGPMETVMNGKTGLLAKPFDAKDLADKMLYVLENKEAAKRFGENGLIQSKKYSWDKIGKQTYSVYESLF